MEFYRVEYLMENFKEFSEKENKTRKDREDEQKAKYSSSSSSQKGLQQYMKGSSNPYKGLSTPKF